MDNKHGTKGNTRNTLLQGLPFCKGQGRDKHHRKEEVGKEQKIRHVQIYTYNKYVYPWYGTTCFKNKLYIMQIQEICMERHGRHEKAN